MKLNRTRKLLKQFETILDLKWNYAKKKPKIIYKRKKNVFLQKFVICLTNI